MTKSRIGFFIIVCIVWLLQGCVSMGLSKMSPDQIKAANGLATCTQIYSPWGKGTTISINIDDVRKGATSKGRIIVSPDCAVTIQHDVGVEPVNSNTNEEKPK